MNEKEIVLTPEGLKRLQERLEHYKTHQRREVADRIREAKDFGEIGENAEYELAKTEQAFVESEIANLENMIRHARVLEKKEIHTDVVSLGSHVQLEDLKTHKKIEYTIVGTEETDPANGKVSNESPMGAILIGKKKETDVILKAPGGEHKYRILRILRGYR